MWIANNQYTIVVTFHDDFVAGINSELFQGHIVWGMFVKCHRNQMLPSVCRYYSIFIILMYLCKSVPPIKIVSHGDVIFTSGSLDYPKIVNHSPMTIFTTDSNSIFSHSLSLTHSISLSLRQLALFPFFPFEYKYDVVAYYRLLRF